MARNQSDLQYNRNVNTHLHLWWLQTGIVIFLALVAPILDAFHSRRLRQHCTSKERVQHYMVVLTGSLVLALAAVWMLGPPAVLTAGGSLNDAQGPLANAMLRIALLALAAAFLYLAAIPSIKSLRNPKIFAAYARAIKKSQFSFLFPTTVAERKWFAALSINAGLCEEIIFRSYLTAYFHNSPLMLGPFCALAASSLVFGLNHAYQGWSGILKTGVSGLILGILFFATGSLALCMVCHALMDLQVLLMLKPDWIEAPDASATHAA